MKNVLYYSKITRDNGSIWVLGTDKDIYYIGGHNSGFNDLSLWAKKKYPTYELISDDQILENAVEEIESYLDGKVKEFSFEVDYSYGTPFQQKVWRALQEVSFGETVTYTDIAKQIGRPDAVRAVAGAIGANQLLIAIPCHRVIGKNGKLVGYRGGIEMKESLLKLES
ncbi:methylated-DNA--[protein]-cysteine S-methyltransferase [Oceanobacillus kimchii]|uniref:Methylated-DNA--[protein]-cysteine S-methyltransferase n=1 Tax=Oceanobacillus kimchii TaxID=746691 RepID=A0ABQ5THZ3_9BACI|nr:methylated-DNA--[protein]-cysteine S-methyltransferase [Oceanobacillus kimchii]GLO65194.1 methylated-DNA--[protein]-cysteine S-methyltransferase [Oceanobacillus kimchii]